jgi:CheY-like chemotaxis protein
MATSVSDDEATILLIDDDDLVMMVLERAMRKHNLNNPFERAHDGVEGLNILRRLVNAGKRFVVLLDINMPLMNGIEMLGQLRTEPSIAQSLVFMFTTSHSPEDKTQSYEKNVAGYIVKSNLDNGFVNVISMLRSFLGTVELPDSPLIS